MILSDLLFWLPLMVFDEGIILTNGMDGSYVILGNIIYTYVINNVTTSTLSASC
jgi:phospholipid-transporting ATPase